MSSRRPPDGGPAPGRRRLLQGIAGLAALGCLPSAQSDSGAGSRLRLLNTHTGEVTEAEFASDGRRNPAALGRLDWAFRDHRASRVRPIDARLYDLLAALAAAAGVPARYEVISGYRSPATNAMLAARGGGVSDRSLHMQGRAVDVRLEGVALGRLRDLALAAGAGGVGYYPRSDFLHLDVGRVRSWSG